MQISRKRDPGEPDYEMNGGRLEATKESTYLGIILQNDLGWGKQTQHAVTKVTRALDFIKRIFACAQTILSRGYISLVYGHTLNMALQLGITIILGTSLLLKKISEELHALS